MFRGRLELETASGRLNERHNSVDEDVEDEKKQLPLKTRGSRKSFYFIVECDNADSLRGDCVVDVKNMLEALHQIGVNEIDIYCYMAPVSIREYADTVKGRVVVTSRGNSITCPVKSNLSFVRDFEALNGGKKFEEDVDMFIFVTGHGFRGKYARMTYGKRALKTSNPAVDESDEAGIKNSFYYLNDGDDEHLRQFLNLDGSAEDSFILMGNNVSDGGTGTVMVTDDKINDMLRSKLTPTSCVRLFFDTCHCATMADFANVAFVPDYLGWRNKRRVLNSRQVIKKVKSSNREPYFKNAFSLSAAQDDKLANSDFFGGVFTYCFFYDTESPSRRFEPNNIKHFLSNNIKEIVRVFRRVELRVRNYVKRKTISSQYNRAKDKFRVKHSNNKYQKIVLNYEI
jgi:hypothetical protein